MSTHDRITLDPGKLEFAADRERRMARIAA
jgi:hypothetical protein